MPTWTSLLGRTPRTREVSTWITHLKWQNGESPVVICFPHSGIIHWHALYRKWGRGLIGVFSTQVNVFRNEVHLSPPACLASPGFSLELPKGMVYAKRERERDPSFCTEKDERAEQSTPPVTAQSMCLSFLQRDNFSSRLTAQPLAHES